SISAEISQRSGRTEQASVPREGVFRELPASAGSGIIAGMRRLRASTVCVNDSALLCVRLRDPSSGVVRLFVPGGAVDAGETPAQAAARETHEETGYAVEVD